MRSVRSLLIGIFVLALLSAAIAWQTPTPPAPAPKAAPTALLPVLHSDGQRWWKGNLHTHSLWSDGDHFPEMIADWYKERGYHFLTLSDHNVLSDGERWLDLTNKARTLALDKYRERFGPWVETRELNGKQQARLKPLAEFRSLLEVPGQFLLIPGEEVTHSYAKAPVHMNAINLRDVIKPIDGASKSETIQVNHRAVAEQQKRTKQRILTFLNHPNFHYGVAVEEMIPVEELRFFEVYNGHPSVKNRGDATRPGTERMWDILLALRLGKHKLPLVYGLATDDAHRYHTFKVGESNPGRGWIMVQTPFLSAESIVRAMEAGQFYASTGVTLRTLERTGDKLTVAIAGEKDVQYKTQYIATLREAPLQATERPDGKGLVYSEAIGKVAAESAELVSSYRFTGQELYVRVKVTSTKLQPNPCEKGDVETAWTQPMLP